MNATQALTTQEITDHTDSIEDALIIIGQRIQSEGFAQKLRERLATGLDIEYRVHIKKHGEGYGLFFSYRRKTPVKSIMVFNHVT